MKEQELNAAAIQEVAKLAKDSLRHRLVTVDLKPPFADVSYYYDEMEGTLHRIQEEPKQDFPRLHNMKAFINYLGTLSDIVGITYNASSMIVSFRTDKGRFGKTVFGYTYQKEYRNLVDRKVGGLQRAFWNELRTTYREAVPRDLINLIKKVRWDNSAGHEGVVGHVQESISKEVMRNVIGEGAIPEEVILNVGVFDVEEVRDLKYPVVCALDTNSSEKSFTLVPCANQLERAQESAFADLVKPLLKDYGKFLMRGLY